MSLSSLKVGPGRFTTSNASAMRRFRPFELKCFALSSANLFFLGFLLVRVWPWQYPKPSQEPFQIDINLGTASNMATNSRFSSLCLGTIRTTRSPTAIMHESLTRGYPARLPSHIAKLRGSCYESGKRSGAWLKYKVNKPQALVIGG